MNDNTISLSNKVTSSAFWIFLFQVLDNIMGFLRLLILARVLGPSDFGLIAIAWLVLQTIAAFTQTGLHQTLIHKPSIDGYLNTAWTYLIGRGAVLYTIVFLTAPWLSSFFNSPDSLAIIRIVSLSLVIDGFTNIGIITFHKNLTFKRQFIYQLSGNLVDFIVAIVLAFILRDVWALVYASLANSVTRLIMGYILSEYRPSLEFKFDIFKEMNTYGKWIAGSNMLQFIYSQGDDLLVGRLLGPTSLGLYQLAYKISNLPATQITHIISTVMFPAYSNIQNDIQRISKIYLSVLQLVTFLSFFIGAMIICFAYDFTYLFLGEKWLPMVPAMQLLTIWGVIRSVGAMTGPVWQALGTPKTVTKIQTIQTIILVGIIYPLTIKWGINGTAIAVVIGALIPNIIANYLICKTLHIRLLIFIKELSYPFISSLIFVLCYFLLSHYFQNSNIIMFFSVALICSIVYLLMIFILHVFFQYTLYNNISPIIKNHIQKFKN